MDHFTCFKKYFWILTTHRLQSSFISANVARKSTWNKRKTLLKRSYSRGLKIAALCIKQTVYSLIILRLYSVGKTFDIIVFISKYLRLEMNGEVYGTKEGEKILS